MPTSKSPIRVITPFGVRTKPLSKHPKVGIAYPEYIIQHGTHTHSRTFSLPLCVAHAYGYRSYTEDGCLGAQAMKNRHVHWSWGLYSWKYLKLG